MQGKLQEKYVFEVLHVSILLQDNEGNENFKTEGPSITSISSATSSKGKLRSSEKNRVFQKKNKGSTVFSDPEVFMIKRYHQHD